MTDMRAIALACVSECERQQVSIERLGMLIKAYNFALGSAETLPTMGNAHVMAMTIEPCNTTGFRTVPVTFSDGGSAGHWREIPSALSRMYDNLDRDTDPDEFTKALLQLHPRLDGNGRVAFIIHNWLSGTLDNPHPLPDHFGEHVSNALPCHLRGEAAGTQCSACGRPTWAESEFNNICLMTQPDSTSCGGWFGYPPDFPR